MTLSKGHSWNKPIKVHFFELIRPEKYPHLSAGRSGISDLLGHLGEDGDEPALPVKLVPQSSAHAAKEGGQ